PVQHLPRLQLVDPGVLVEPGLVGDLGLGQVQHDALQLILREEGWCIGIYVHPLLPPELPERLPGQVRMVIHLSPWRADQQAEVVLEGAQPRHPRLDLAEDLVQQRGVGLAVLVQVAQVDPHPPALDGLQGRPSLGPAEVALPPLLQVAGALRGHAEQIVVGARVPVEQGRQRVVAEQRALVQPVLQHHG
ncbi:MAG: hypothetical protein ACK559_21470, partial [bacterium]